MRMLSLGGKWASWSAMLPQSLADARRHGVACFLYRSEYNPALHPLWSRDTAATPPPSPIHPDTPVSLGKEPSPHCVNRLGIWGLQLEILRPRWPFPSVPIYLVGLLIWDICFWARLPHYKANSLQQIFCLCFLSSVASIFNNMMSKRMSHLKAVRTSNERCWLATALELQVPLEFLSILMNHETTPSFFTLCPLLISE